MNWYFEVLKKYAVFSGRARRREYWMFQLWYWIILVVLSVLYGISQNTKVDFLFTGVAVLYVLATMIPNLAVTIRRLHDSSTSGWWILINIVPFVGGFVLFIFTLLGSDPGENKYGPNPKTS